LSWLRYLAVHRLREQDRAADATACLRPICNRFTYGFATADLAAAKQLLDELEDGRKASP
jgi:predicted ATPase